jgi:hypothetical protein
MHRLPRASRSCNRPWSLLLLRRRLPHRRQRTTRRLSGWIFSGWKRTWQSRNCRVGRKCRIPWCGKLSRGRPAGSIRRSTTSSATPFLPPSIPRGTNNSRRNRIDGKPCGLRERRSPDRHLFSARSLARQNFPGGDFCPTIDRLQYGRQHPPDWLFIVYGDADREIGVPGRRPLKRSAEPREWPPINFYDSKSNPIALLPYRVCTSLVEIGIDRRFLPQPGP